MLEVVLQLPQNLIFFVVIAHTREGGAMARGATGCREILEYLLQSVYVVLPAPASTQP